ncbi:armadillo repeat-containing protein 6 homolog [Choristoneura fumiferana]|uniref:armadillo repeat-containing protein 6 homolog n=1 Tax=Choristoneura fumiferana TaxID=7141 RepID=UPI003D157381
MVRVITQETYDEVVQENIKEFDMSAEEAIQDATAQFEAQGVDLSNIIKDLVLSSGEDHAVSKAITKLKELKNEGDDGEIFKELEILKAECNKDIARRVKAGKEGAYTVLLELLQARQKTYSEEANEKDARYIVNVLNCLVALMDVQPDLLDQRGVDVIKNILDNTEDENILMATLKWTSTCCIKHEMNRQRLFAKNIASNLKSLLQVQNNVKLLSEVLAVIRKFPLDDDIRVEFGKAHDHARELGFLMLDSLTNLLKENSRPPLVSELMQTISSLLVRHELCAAVADGGAGVLFTVLADNADNAAVVQQASRLITALAGNDDVKRQLVKSGIVPIMVLMLTRHCNNASATSSNLKCVAALALREPEHSRQFYDCGAPEAIVDCLNRHPDHPGVQKNGCWAIRNMVARCRDMNPKFKELGVEAILNRAYERFLDDFGFDVKSALRDLECDVKFDEQWTGKGFELEQ